MKMWTCPHNCGDQYISNEINLVKIMFSSQVSQSDIWYLDYKLVIFTNFWLFISCENTTSAKIVFFIKISCLSKLLSLLKTLTEFRKFWKKMSGSQIVLNHPLPLWGHSRYLTKNCYFPHIWCLIVQLMPNILRWLKSLMLGVKIQDE